MTDAAVPSIIVEAGLRMQTRDGVELVADVFRPDTDEPAPVLLMRSPYGSIREHEPVPAGDATFFAERGYVVVSQDTRGRGRSGGRFYPFVHEAQDGYDAVEWAAALPWSNGDVAMIGQSYVGLVQYAAAPLRPPHLRTFVPVSGPLSLHDGCVYHGGAFELGWMLAYFTGLERATYARRGTYRAERERLDGYVTDPAGAAPPLTDDAYRHLPLRDWGERLCGDLPYLADFLAHPDDGPYWWATDPRRRAADISVPALHVGGWYDAFQLDTLAMFSGARASALTPEARDGQGLLMGPWAHLQPFTRPTTGGAGDIDFGPAAAIELQQVELAWLERHLRGVEDAVTCQSPVRIFVMGVNEWRDEQEWPLARTVYTDLFLHSGSGANGVHGDGSVSFAAPADERPDSYVYDPEDPVPTRGGNLVGDGMGVVDQRDIEARVDVLVYTGDELQSPLEVTGPVTAELFVTSTAPDTDFTVKLVDVHPDGFAQNVVDGIIRARYRNSPMLPEPLVPGEVARVTLDLWATSHVFLPGHRVRVDVSSSNFPRFDRNPNSGLPFGTDTAVHTAHQQVLHDTAHPSRVILPVIPE